MKKVLIVLAVVLVASIIQIFINRAIGVNHSNLGLIQHLGHYFSAYVTGAVSVIFLTKDK